MTQQGWRLVRIAVCAVMGGLVACHSPALSPEQKMAQEMSAMHAAIPEIIKDVPRAAKMQAKVSELQAEIESFDQSFLVLGKKIRHLNADPDAKPAQFQAILNDFDKYRIAARQRLINTHLDMLKLSTADEWKQLAPYEHEAMVVVFNHPGGK